METLRRTVLPVLWIVIGAVIALALAKLAFFPAGALTSPDDGEQPTGTAAMASTVLPERGDIEASLELSGTVEPDAGTPVRATTEGEINHIWVENGDVVSPGDQILQVRFPEEQAAVAQAPTAAEDAAAPDAAEGAAAAAAPAEPSYRYVTLYAPEGGTVMEFSALVGQTLSIGDPVATVSPGTYSITAPITPEQQLQLLDIDDLQAQAAVPTAADPIACTDPRIDESAAGEGEQPAPAPDPGGEAEGPDGVPAAEGVGSSGVALRCPVPENAEVVPGLAVPVTIDLGSVSDVLTVPVTAVSGSGTEGTVQGIDPSTGDIVEIPVSLGLRGTETVEVTGGLAEDQEILLYAPGVDNTDADMMGGW